MRKKREEIRHDTTTAKTTTISYSHTTSLEIVSIKKKRSLFEKGRIRINIRRSAKRRKHRPALKKVGGEKSDPWQGSKEEMYVRESLEAEKKIRILCLVKFSGMTTAEIKALLDEDLVKAELILTNWQPDDLQELASKGENIMYRSRAAYGIFSSYGGMRRFSSSSSVVVERTFSGIQPSGTPHLGNYFGAIKQWVHGQSSKSTDIFSIVDLHALTNLHDPKELRHHIHSLAAGLLASGLHPDKCILFQQSQVHEHTELCWILGSVCTVPALQRMTQFKDKTKGVKDPPLGLLIYPVLQCADILLYKGTKVPIGEDNLQNLEIARSLCRTFNRTYKQNYFPEPVPILSQTSSKKKNLRNPSKKMSKSDKDTKSCIYISDSPDIILEKCKKAVTDSTSELTYDPENRPGCI
ncbi:WARS [Lepeophtheirus salmonis]|uniref:tryptophan--tRNA ligase n=1 Tax=Lepeophtheirus salmonis TaxID=72036 RepID=A0A7R8D6R3_LEPSM|nr:WARS [Lepeophtheirus salmonis]CAF3043396.1 WARS [Lepeophtheirus salmonis]